MRYFLFGLLLLGNLGLLRAQKPILAAEYFFDNLDPGYGSASPVTVSQPAEQIDLIFDVPTTGLTPGLHQIDVRVKRDSGWSDTHRRFFYLNQLPLQREDTAEVVQAEYYFGPVDPGYGLAQPLAVPDPGTQVTLIDELHLNVLPPGFHDFSVRVRNSNGSWSDTHQRFFFLPDTFTTYRLSELRYEIRQGTNVVGTGSLPLSPLQYTVELTFDASTGGLAPGFYDLCVTAVDEAGREGLAECRPFEVRVPVAVSPALATGLSAYPNPTAGPLTLVGRRAPLMAYHLSDMQGRQLLEAQLPPGSMEAQLDLTTLPAGRYFLAVEQAGRVTVMAVERR
jgi:hypothetical protein